MFGGGSLNVWETEENFASGCAKSNLPQYCSSFDTEYESLFDQARKIPLSSLKPSQMAHSGKIGKGARKKQESRFKVIYRLYFASLLTVLFTTIFDSFFDFLLMLGR